METLNIYKIWVDHSLDAYSSAIVVAENEEAARHIHPGTKSPERPVMGWNDKTCRYDKPWYESDELDLVYWTKPENINVELVGITTSYAEGTVLCASYNAG